MSKATEMVLYRTCKRMIERGSGRRYKVRFRILEVLSELFGNRS